MEQQSQPQSQQSQKLRLQRERQEKRRMEEKRRMDLLLNSSGKNKQSESLKDFHDRLRDQISKISPLITMEGAYHRRYKEFYKKLLSVSDLNVWSLSVNMSTLTRTEELELARIISVKLPQQ